MKRKSIVVLLSGGMDSTTLLYALKAEGHHVRALAVNYGQRHNRELRAAVSIADEAHVPIRVIDLSDLRYALPGSSQTDNAVPVPEGHYSEESMKATVVPNRNMILLACAIGHAVAHKCDEVAYAAHAGDHAVYPDCRPAFADKMAEVALLCDWHQVQLVRPFIDITKAGIVSIGAELNVPYRMTWSCYKGGEMHCGKCGTCVERVLAFTDAGVPDPTQYEDNLFAFKAEQEYKAAH